MSGYTLGPVEIAIVPLHEGASDPSTVRVSLDGEQGHEYVSLKQYDDEEVTLDFEEIPLLVEAVELLRQTASKKTVEESEPAAEEEEPEEKEWDEPSKEFLLSINTDEALFLLAKPFHEGLFHLIRAFPWLDSPQGIDYWNGIHWGRTPFTQEQKDIVCNWLIARLELDEVEEEPEEEEPKQEEKEASWPLPSESFLIRLQANHILPLLTEPFSPDNRHLHRAFTWAHSPQGHYYWSKFPNHEAAFGEEQKSILESWLIAHFKAKKKQAAKAKAEKEVEKEPTPSEGFLRSICPEHTLRLLTKPFDSGDLSGAFVWSSSPQGRDYWSKFAYGEASFGEQQKVILTSWLTALDELR
jgi:hypothetical protein